MAVLCLSPGTSKMHRYDKEKMHMPEDIRTNLHLEQYDCTDW